MNELKPTVKSAHPITGVELVPSSKGVFDVLVDGTLVFSKHQAGRHAVIEEVVQAVRSKLNS